MDLDKDLPGLDFERGEPPTPPSRILVFGASGQLGGPLAERVLARESGPAVRVVTQSDDKVAGLRARFPAAEVAVANYYDLPSLLDAFTDVEAVFVVTPAFRIDERLAMTNIAAAVHHAGTVSHVLRVTGSAPGHNHVAELLPFVRDVDGPARGFQEAREVLTACRVPVSYLNIYAYLMSDLLNLWIAPLVTRRVFANPYDRFTTFVDPTDAGHAAAELLLAGHDPHHEGIWYDLTGSSRIRFSEVADVLSEELGLPISYEDDPVRCYQETAPHLAEIGGDISYHLRFQQNEYREAPSFVVTDTLPELLGRAPKTLREYIAEHRADLRGETELGQRIKAAARA